MANAVYPSPCATCGCTAPNPCNCTFTLPLCFRWRRWHPSTGVNLLDVHTDLAAYTGSVRTSLSTVISTPVYASYFNMAPYLGGPDPYWFFFYVVPATCAANVLPVRCDPGVAGNPTAYPCAQYALADVLAAGPSTSTIFGDHFWPDGLTVSSCGGGVFSSAFVEQISGSDQRDRYELTAGSCSDLYP